MTNRKTLVVIAIISISVGANVTVIAEYSPDSLITRKEIIKHVSRDGEFVEAVNKAASTLCKFVDAWNNRGYNKDQFVVVVAAENGKSIVPLGILVDDIDCDLISGRMIQNSLPMRTGQLISCSTAHVIDWRYRNALELTGGVVYRELLGRLRPVSMQRILEDLPFYVRKIGANSALHQSIADGNCLPLKHALSRHDAQLEKLVEVPCRSVEGTDCIGRTRVNIAEYALMYGDSSCVELVIKNEENGPKLLRSPPVYLSAGEGNRGAVRRLVDLGVDIDEIDEETGFSALHVSVLMSDKETTAVLLDAGANIDVRSYDGQSPIFFARTTSIVRQLLGAGSTLNAVDGDGKTVLDRRLEDRDDVLAECLQNFGAERSAKQLHIDEHMTTREAIAEIRTQVGNAASSLSHSLEQSIGVVLPVRVLVELR